MKRQIFLLVSIVCISVYSNQAVAEELNVQECAIVTGFYELWKTSFFGTELKRVETAAWIRFNADQKYEFILWETTPEIATNTWRGSSIPKNVLAIAHTHPQRIDPKPSKGDIELAKKLNLLIYTISGKGIWYVNPSGSVRQVAGRKWHYDLNSCQRAVQATAGFPQTH